MICGDNVRIQLKITASVI